MKMIYHDAFGNTATIEEVMVFAYKGATNKEKAYRLSVTSDYDNDFLYHVSLQKKIDEALWKMQDISCGTWERHKSKYTIKSTSDEGVYYLVKGWKKCKTFWFNEKSVMENTENAKKFFFNKPSQAKASLTKLLKIMPDYANDKFEIVEF